MSVVLLRNKSLLFTVDGAQQSRHGMPRLWDGVVGITVAPAKRNNGQSLLRMAFVFLQILRFLYSLGYLSLKRSRISIGEKKQKNKHTHSCKARQGHIKHACKNSGSISRQRRGHLDFSAVKCKNHVLAS